jgi:NADH-ubiquinone oxidoreductase chain 2
MILSCLGLLLISISVNKEKDNSIMFSRVLLLLLYYSIHVLINNNYFFKSIGFYMGLYYISYTSHIFHIFIFMLTFVIINLTAFFNRKLINNNLFSIINLHKYLYNVKVVLYKTSKQFKIKEYSLIILFIITGALFLICSNDLISIFLSIELQSYGLYIISTIFRNSELSTSAGLTYFLLGSLSSCLILLSSSILYVNSGLTYIEGLYIITNISDLINTAKFVLN